MTVASPPDPQGFTLIEVIVALVMTSIILMIVMNGALEAKQRRMRAEDRDRAVLLASSLIAGQAAAAPGVIRKTGEIGRLRWTLSETEFARDPRGFFVLDHIEVRLTDSQGAALYAVSTRKLKPVAEQ